MACVTLKRPLDHFDGGLHHAGHPSPGGHHHRPPPSKRRRCAPVNHVNRHREHSRDLFESSGPSNSSSGGYFATSSGAAADHHISAVGSSGGGSSSSSSVFRETPLTPGEIANNLRDELKRLRRRRQLAPYDASHHHQQQQQLQHRSQLHQQGSPGSPGGSGPSSPEPMMDDATAMRTATSLLRFANVSPAAAATSGSLVSRGAAANSSEGKPIFTLRQMTMICERMCKERTDQVRDEYDKILHQKLSEQYDAFVKFIDHQIQQRFNEAQLPSYLS